MEINQPEKLSDTDSLTAQLQRRNRIMYIGVLAGLGVVVIGLIVLLVSAGSLTSPPPAPSAETVSPGPAQQEPIEQQPVQDEPPRSTASPEDKQQTLAAMQKFNDEIRAKVTAFSDLAGSPRYLDLVSELEADLVSLTGQGRYQDARTIIATATTKIEGWMANDLSQFEQLVGEADAAWQAKALTKLAGILAKADSLYTGYPEPIDHYRALSTDWPAVNAGLHSANTAHTENRLAAEQKALKAIAQLNHDIDGLNDRIRSVGRQLHQQNVDDLLIEIARALAAPDAPAARSALSRLKKLDPKSAEIPKLQTDLAAVEKQIAFAAAMRKMDELAAADKWADAFQVASDNKEQFGSYVDFTQRADFIEKIHYFITASSAMLNAPDNLINPSAQNKATTLIADAQTSQSFSPSLTKLIADLDDMLVSYTTPIDIVVLSDNQTFVEVKSVGQVGIVVKKTIQLPPGDYVFHGKRKGFVTKREPVKIRPGDKDKQISVIANDQI